ncbi:23568_t:CDS:2, partial [Cetraspora pellucida]
MTFISGCRTDNEFESGICICKNPQAVLDIKWLQENLRQKNARLAWKPSQILKIYVDASTTGWSATLGEKKAFGNWKYHHKHTDIALLESTAALLGLESFAHIIAHRWVTIYIDNQVARKTIEAGERRPWQKEIMCQVWSFCDEHDVQIHEFCWVPSQLNPADELTRFFNESDWVLAQSVYKELNKKWGHFTIDRMASLRTRK